jgi:TRAP-type C4-dicarboxylate transport system permease small subunit
VKWLNRLEEIILVIALSAMAVIAFANVISRYFLHASLSFTEELTTNLFVYAIFIGASLLARENGHLGFSLLTDLVPVPLKKTILTLVALLTLLFFVILLWYGVEMVMQQVEYGAKTSALGIPEWIMGVSIPLGAFICLFRFTEGFWKEFKRLGRDE